MRVPQISQVNVWKWDKNLQRKILCWNDACNNILAVLMYERLTWSLHQTFRQTYIKSIWKFVMGGFGDFVNDILIKNKRTYGETSSASEYITC
jgi:hypothetical protein